MKSAIAFLAASALALPALAGVQGFNGTSNLGIFSQVQCPATGGLTCAKAGAKLTFSLAQTPISSVERSRFSHGWVPAAATSATSTTPSATTVYMTQVYIPYSVTLTGISVLNGATVGTDKYVAALFNSAGTALANSATAGTTTSGASVFQSLAFTATKVVAPGTYWIGLYVNGTTDRFYSIPAIGALGGLAGSVTGQTFGTVAAVVLPTTFTADKGPVAYVY
jgi:hypothetical protein